MLTPLTTPKDLAHMLGTTPRKLNYTLYAKGVNTQYTSFSINKKNGSYRTIHAPLPQLKRLQQRLVVHLERLYEPHCAAMGFVKKRGILENAKKHIKKRFIFNIDLENFFNQINFGRVRGLLTSKPYSLQEDTATIIAHMCCYQRTTPQGAPTSPIISNMICKKLDRELSFLAKQNKAFYTRYADDITFSFHSETENEIYQNSDPADPSGTASVSEKLDKIILSNGFSIKKEKTRLQKNTQRQIVTGLKVNTKVNLDRRYIRTTRAMIHSLSGNIAAANEKFKILHPEKKGNLENIVFGRITYIGMIKGVDSSVYQSLAKKYNNLPLSSKIPTKPRKDVNNLNNRLHFSGYEIKSRLNRCVWVVSFEGVDGISEWDQMTQGTAFMLKGQRILTAAHVFEKAQSPAYCYLYRINEPTQKHKAEIIRKCSISDVAELRIIAPPQSFFEYLKISSNLETNSGYKLAVIGFPQLMNGHTDVTIIPCTVTNTYTRSAIKHVQVDADIQAGNSGGPVINAYAEVVGMATNGISATLDNDSGDINLEGFNSFVSAKHFSTQN